MAWTDTNALADIIDPNWGTQTRSAIALYEGINVTAAIGIVIDVSAEGFASVDDYSVECSYQEDPGPNSGYLYPVKTVNTVTIMNSGTTYGKKVHYRVKEVVGLP